MLLKRKLLLLLLLVLLVSWGCFPGKKTATVKAPTPEPVPAATPEAAPSAVTPPAAIPSLPAPLESAPLSKTITAPNYLELGEMNFQLGNYPQAIKAYEAYLSGNPKGKNRDLALFHLGLSRALAGDSNRDMRQAEAAFRRLISEFPTTQYRNQAEFILGLQVQIDKLKADLKEREDKIKKLSDELQALKDIDLQRRPSRPKE
jgi:tetratricopeptide (TPR) repeat protein